MVRQHGVEARYWSDDKQWMLNLRAEDLDGLFSSFGRSGSRLRRDRMNGMCPKPVSLRAVLIPKVTISKGNNIEMWEPLAQ